VPIFAGIIRNVTVIAFGAGSHMPAERLGPAGFYCRHHLELGEADMPSIGPPPRGAIPSEYVSNLQL
jgi:hypothetical protein